MPGNGRHVVATSFLSSGPLFRLPVRDDFIPLPQLVTPIDIGGAGRECMFQPTDIEQLRAYMKPQADSMRQESIKGADDRLVDIYHMPGSGQWLMRWQLRTGGLYVHIRDLDGRDKVDAVAQHLRVADPLDATPTVAPDPPLSRRVDRTPGYQERIGLFAIASGSVKIGIELRRPGSMREGAEGSSRNGSRTTYRRGGPKNVDIAVDGEVSDDEAREFGRELSDAIAQA